MPFANPKSLELYRKIHLSSLKLSAAVAGIYAALSVVYIVYSSWLAAHVAHTPHAIRMIETSKGVVFVMITASLVFMLVRYWSRRTKEQEELLLKMERQSMASLFNAALAHDLNNLLMSFHALVGELREQEAGSDFLRAAREQIERGIESLAGLSQRLAASALNKNAARIVPVELRDTLIRTANLVRKHTYLRNKTLTVAAMPTLTLPLDREMLAHAVINLIINAAQAIDMGGRIEIRLEPADDFVHIEVHDNGPGIPPDLAKRIFETGFTTKAEGTGLGLLSVRHFANTCSGTVMVDQSPLGGALFRIAIPAIQQVRE